jgi:hypothetical protein
LTIYLPKTSGLNQNPDPSDQKLFCLRLSGSGTRSLGFVSDPDPWISKEKNLEKIKFIFAILKVND